MPRNKTETIVVRPINRGADAPRKTVLAPLKQLNHHQPLAKLAPNLVAPHPKPWKQQSTPKCYRQRLTPASRGVGVAAGAHWHSDNYVCGAAIGPAWEFEDHDTQEEWEQEWPREDEYFADEEQTRARRVEVRILDIAKPAKRRGPAKDYEVVETVRRVIALEGSEDEGDEEEWEQWSIGSEDEMGYEDWEAIEDEGHRRVSYATVLQQTPG